jgi:hypothetical protein
MKSFFKGKIFIKVLGELFFLFGLLAWFDGIAIQLVHPEWLPLPVSHLVLWIRTDTFTILCFFVSAFGFFIWRFMSGILKQNETKAT